MKPPTPTAPLPTLGAALCALVVMAAAPAARGGESATPYRGSFSAVGAKHYEVRPDEAEFYAEEWELRAWSEAGDSVSVNFVVNNLGFGDNKPVVQASARAAGGKKVTGQAKFDEGDWSHGSKPFRLSAGGSSLSGGPGEVRVKIALKDVRMDLTFENQLPPWRPAGGRLQYGSADRYYDVTYLAPRAKVRGVVTAGGRSFTLRDATGWVDHRNVNVPPQVAGKRWLTWRSFEGDWTLLVQDVTFPRDMGGRKARYLLVGYKDRIVFQAVRFKVKYGDLRADPKSDKGYKYPLALRIEADAGDRSVVLTVRGKLRARRDLLGSLGAAKALVGRFVAPVGYYLDGDYDLRVRLSDGQAFTHSGEGDYVFKQVNP